MFEYHYKTAGKIFDFAVTAICHKNEKYNKNYRNLWKMHFSKIRPRFMGNGNCLWAEHIMIKKHHYYRSASFSDRMQHTVFCSPTDIFRSKYGNIEKRNGSILLRKKLQGSGRKYFDSGDYNMQKEAIKPASRISTIPGKCPLWFRIKHR